MVRIAYLTAYAALAALGEALVARPALLWLRSQGLLRPALAWDVPFGVAALACAALVAGTTLWLASDAALGKKPRTPTHAAFLLLLAFCLGVRGAVGEPRPPRDPVPSLLQGLRAAAVELDRDYRGSYAPDAGQLNFALAQVAPPGFRRLARRIPLHARVLSGADGAQREPLPEDLPGTIYVAISKDRKAAWITALSLDAVLKQSIEAHAGTHNLPGRDPLVPAYPGMRSVIGK